MFTLAIAAALAGTCPDEPALRDPDGEVTVLAQNLKFIVTGTRRQERNELFAEWLRGEGARVDLLLLSEARLTGGFEAWAPEWCFYTQAGDRDGYRWAPIASAGRPPAGLAIGIRQRSEGEPRHVGSFAGRAYRATPTSFAEGVLGRLFGFRKGWAGIDIDGTHLVWSHTQASYKTNPENGAGAGRRGRAGQFDDLAEDLGRPEKATLLTGDLNLLAGFRPKRAEDEARVQRARAIDSRTVETFAERTGIDLTWPWAPRGDRPGKPARGLGGAVAAREAPAEAATASADTLTEAQGEPAVSDLPSPVLASEPPADDGPVGTFAGGIDRRRADDAWDTGAAYDRVGVNAAFLARHPGTRVRRVEIAKGWMRVSDHFGLEIAIPFKGTPPKQAAKRAATRRFCLFGDGGRLVPGTVPRAAAAGRLAEGLDHGGAMEDLLLVPR